MVALKPRLFAPLGAEIWVEKQERRGGIETRVEPLLKLRERLKQERRGGIETTGSPPEGPPPSGEAGTPWWH